MLICFELNFYQNTSNHETIVKHNSYGGMGKYIHHGNAMVTKRHVDNTYYGQQPSSNLQSTKTIVIACCERDGISFIMV